MTVQNELLSEEEHRKIDPTSRPGKVIRDFAA